MLQALARGTPGRIWRRFIAPADPAAGANVEIPPATARAWQVLSVSCGFAASDADANRDIVLVHFNVDGNVLQAWPLAASLTANDAVLISWQAGLGDYLLGSATYISVPLATPLYVMPGEILAITGIGDAADQFSAIRAVVIECDTGDTAHNLAVEQRIIDHADAIRDLISGSV